MTLGRAEATLIADVIDAQQRALGRALSRSEMDLALKVAADTAVDAMRISEREAFDSWGLMWRKAEQHPSPALHDKTWCRCASCAAWRRKFVTAP